MTTSTYWRIVEGQSPIVATTTISSTPSKDDELGIQHQVLNGITEKLISCFPNQVIVDIGQIPNEPSYRRHFTIDRNKLNGHKQKVWRHYLPPIEEEAFTPEIDPFYAEIYPFFKNIDQNHNSFLVIDFKETYSSPAPDLDPNCPSLPVFVGTVDGMDNQWNAIIQRFISQLRRHQFQQSSFFVRNAKQLTRQYFPYWTTSLFGKKAWVMSIEIGTIHSSDPHWTNHCYETFSNALVKTIPSLLSDINSL